MSLQVGRQLQSKPLLKRLVNGMIYSQQWCYAKLRRHGKNVQSNQECDHQVTSSFHPGGVLPAQPTGDFEASLNHSLFQTDPTSALDPALAIHGVPHAAAQG